MKFLWILTIFIATAVVADDSGSSSSSSSSSTATSGTNLFVDSESTYYDGYQQAWRYLGWYVKCGSPSDRYSNQQHHSHSGDSSASEESVNHYCQRYLIWAAYVDESYQGGGIGEYSYFNHSTQAWDNSACTAHGNGRCAPMDCHETNTTTWKLMGVFKEASYFGNDAFFEQLFKHEGICVWNNDNLYSFMQTARKNYWPNGCISTGIQIKNSYSSGYGSYLYLDLRPTWNGNMTYGLYTDDICKNEYDLPDMNVDTITKNLGLLYGSGLQTWNNGLEAFKVCQPCKAYNLKNKYASSNYYGTYSDSSDPNNGYFQCYDDAGYTNVNQCMKFRSHAELEVCTWEDLVTATNQGGILQVKVGDTIFGSERMTQEEYQSLLKSQRESNLKWSKAQAQTVAMYRLEAEKVEELKPTAQSWSSLGGTSIAIGAIAILGAVLSVTKRHIDRMFPPKALSEPLLPPSRDFLGKELTKSDDPGGLTRSHDVDPAVPFGNDSDDDEDDLKKAGTIDDNTSVSSLSYVSTSPDLATGETHAVDADAITAWYKNVKKIESHESWTVSDMHENVDDEEENVDIITPTNAITDPEEDDAPTTQPEHSDAYGLTDPEASEANTIQPDHNDDSDNASDVFDGIDASLESPDIEAAVLSPDIEASAEESDDNISTPGKILSNLEQEVEKSTNEGSDDASTKSIVFLGDVSEPSEGNISPIEVCDEQMTEEDIAIIQEDIITPTLDEVAVDDAVLEFDVAETKINEEDVDVQSEEETARISNVSLAETNEPETSDLEYPDEMIQYLSMSASEEGDVVAEADVEVSEEIVVAQAPSNDIEAVRTMVPSDQADDIHDETVDDKNK